MFYFSQPCSHGCSGQGTCQKAGQFLTDFGCTCNPGYYGEMCEHYFAGCDPKSGEPHFCHNGGVCKSTAEPYSYKCECPPDFKGEQCDIPVPEVCTIVFIIFSSSRVAIIALATGRARILDKNSSVYVSRGIMGRGVIGMSVHAAFRAAILHFARTVESVRISRDRLATSATAQRDLRGDGVKLTW